jgi:hypothetical protein
LAKNFYKLKFDATDGVSGEAALMSIIKMPKRDTSKSFVVQIMDAFFQKKDLAAESKVAHTIADYFDKIQYSR